MRTAAFLLLTFCLLGFSAPGLRAQDTAPLRLDVVPESGEVMVEIGDIFSDAELVDALLSGLPLRIQIRIQLWKDGFFDDQKDQSEWRASILFDPLTRLFRVQSSQRTGEEVEVNSLEEAQESLQLALNVPIRPRESGRYYYVGIIEVETLSLSDLEELQRWLKGELAPVVAGEGDVEGALAKGVRRVLVRMLGLPARRFQVPSRKFTVEIGEGGSLPLDPSPFRLPPLSPSSPSGGP